MRYFEYVYLAMAIGLVVFLSFNYEHLKPLTLAALLVGTVIASFMYSFRRRQRIRLDEIERERLKEQEDEIADDDD